MHSAFAGEVRFVVENNGVEKLDTGFNKNIILNQGLHFFGGGNGADMMAYCLVGAGNSEPIITQNQLDSCVAGVTGSVDSSNYSYAPDSTNTYKCSLTKKYVFTTLAGNNISEVGLASQYSGPGSNYLCTRALIKDASGSPTVLSLIAGDTLTIYYKLWVVHSTLDTNQVISMSDGFGGSEQFNVKSRLAEVADGYRNEWATGLPKAFGLAANNIIVGSGDLVEITSTPIGVTGNASESIIGAYNNDFSRIATMKLDTGTGNGSVRTIVTRSVSNHAFGFHQIRFGRVSDDAPIAKDNTKELTIPIKFTWGRYEGAL